MKKIALISLLLHVSFFVDAQNKPAQKEPAQSTVTFPTPTTSTIPADAMFALGQQSIQLQSISGRLDKMEPDISSLKHDVDRLLIVYDMLIYSASAIFTIVASYVIVRLIKRFWPESSPPPQPPLIPA